MEYFPLKKEDLIRLLREYAEWADANIWEVPITLPDHLRQAANAIKPLKQLIAFAKMWPDGIWDGD